MVLILSPMLMIFVSLWLRLVINDVVWFLFCRWVMENYQSSNRFVVEPAALGAAVAGLSYGAARHGTARLMPDVADPGSDGSAAAAADAIIRAEEEAAAAEAARVDAAGEEAVRPAAAPEVDVYASETNSLCSSPEEAANVPGRVRAAVRTLESGVSAETVAVRYGAHDTSRGRAMEREIEQRRRRRARSVSCLDDVEVGRAHEVAADHLRGRHERSDWRTPAPLHRSQTERDRSGRSGSGGYGYIPQFCPPPAFPSGVLGSVHAGGEGGVGRRRRRSRDRARDDSRATKRPRSRSPRRQ